MLVLQIFVTKKTNSILELVAQGLERSTPNLEVVGLSTSTCTFPAFFSNNQKITRVSHLEQCAFKRDEDSLQDLDMGSGSGEIKLDDEGEGQKKRRSKLTSSPTLFLGFFTRFSPCFRPEISLAGQSQPGRMLKQREGVKFSASCSEFAEELELRGFESQADTRNFV